MNVRLVFMQKRKRVWTAQLRHSEATLGRARGCTVRIPSSEVSRLHCRLRMENGIVTVEDLESVNGTFVNDSRIREPEIIHPGDRLTLGPVTFVVEYELDAEEVQPLEGDELVEAEATDAQVEVEVVEEASSKVATKPPPATEPVEVLEVETFPLSENEELNISDSDHLRDFLIELDESDHHSSGK